MTRIASCTIRSSIAASVIVTVALVLASTLLPATRLTASQPESDTATFNIFGLVESPGRYAWAEDMTVEHAVARAGGYASRGSKADLQIQRLVEGKLVSIVVTEEDLVLPDDVVMVRASRYLVLLTTVRP